jgi:hypothetical protein
MEGVKNRNRIRRVSGLVFSIAAFALAVAYLHVEDTDKDTRTGLLDYASEAASIISSSYSHSTLSSNSSSVHAGSPISGLLEVIVQSPFPAFTSSSCSILEIPNFS